MTEKPPPRRPRKTAAKKTAKKPPAKPTLAAVTELPHGNVDQPLLDVLDQAVKAMDWLKDSDLAMVELCREYCRAIDDTKRIADELDVLREPITQIAIEADSKVLLQRLRALEAAADIRKVVGYVGPHLANALRDLGGAPAERKGLQPDAPVNDRLTQLRKSATGRRPPRAR